MRILNMMLGKGLGGIEQASMDYAEGLVEHGHFVVAVTHPKAKINARVEQMGLPHHFLYNLGGWDPLAPGRLRKIVAQVQADVIIAHGNRSMIMAKKAVGGSVPIVAVGHNYRFQHLAGVDAVFAITRHMMQEIEALGMDATRLFHAPNMIRLREGGSSAKEMRAREWHTPPVIGTLGRFVEKKGFDVYVRAIAELKSRGAYFQAVIGGSGEEEAALRALATELDVDDVLTFSGWVDNSKTFLKDLDIFCLPSHHEPFGIVLLEAMAAHLPIVTTDSEGPVEIVKHGKHALIIPKGDAPAMALALADLLHNEVKAKTLAIEAFSEVRAQYTMTRRAEMLSRGLKKVVERFRQEQRCI